MVSQLTTKITKPNNIWFQLDTSLSQDHKELADWLLDGFLTTHCRGEHWVKNQLSSGRLLIGFSDPEDALWFKLGPYGAKCHQLDGIQL